MNRMDRMNRQMRSIPSTFKVREDGEELSIESYFAVFNSNYEICDGMSESIAPGAFTDTISGDIRALINHDTTFVLGRTKAHTLELRQDEHGLWGRIAINPNDGDAMNLYERVKLRDVDQCSFGFDIVAEETDFRDDGSIHWTIKAVKLYEVSICTFPAYEETAAVARQNEVSEIKKRANQKWKAEMLKKLKEEQ